MSGPFADDLLIGHPLAAAPEMTLDEGVAAQYQALTGDPLRLALSAPLSSTVTGRRERLINPGLLLQVAIGQSTVATGRVIANLFYRGVRVRKQVYAGDTVRTTVTPMAATLASRGQRAKVLLRMHTQRSNGESVLDFERVALLPVRDRARFEDHGAVGAAEDVADLGDFAALAPTDWDLSALPIPPSAPACADSLREPITETLALVRLTRNLAAAHRDPAAGQAGQRLVYGGHVVALAQAAAFRFTDPATLLGWRSCDHTGPAFEGDLLATTVEVEDEISTSVGKVTGLRVRSCAQSADAPAREVLDWRPVVLRRESV